MRMLKAALWLFGLLVVSGLALMAWYVPVAAPQSALPSTSGAFLAGPFARGLHFWAAQAALLASLAVVGQTIFVKTNRRHSGWAAGAFLLTGLLWFTGMLLPWDQLNFWLASVFRPPTGLWAIYWLHTLILSVLLFALLLVYTRRLGSTYHETHS